MNLSPQTQAVLLLTVHFSKPKPADARPLTPAEWGRFALWLRNEQIPPDALLSGNLRETLSRWSDRSVTEDRVAKLLDRGSALAIAIEKWLRSGLWVLSRSDADYPRLLKKRLKISSPPIIFGCGNAKLLNLKSVAVVGSRNAPEDDLADARQIGASAADAGVSIVSGGARGVDEAAMSGALQVGGTAIGVLPDSLLRTCSSKKYREHLAGNTLALISPYYPEAGFSAGNAMGRNKYIYCLSDAAIVVHSGRHGGTWNGAVENIDKGWVALWVKSTRDSSAGNAELLARGARCIAVDSQTIDVSKVIRGADRREPAARLEPDLFEYAVREPQVAATAQAETESCDCVVFANNGAANGAAEDISIYEFFLVKLRETCKGEAVRPDEIEERLGLKKAQLNEWLKRAVSEEQVKKLSRPVRYQWRGGDRQQAMF